MPLREIGMMNARAGVRSHGGTGRRSENASDAFVPQRLGQRLHTKSLKVSRSYGSTIEDLMEFGVFPHWTREVNVSGRLLPR
jgi:hypothetical protein